MFYSSLVATTQRLRDFFGIKNQKWKAIFTENNLRRSQLWRFVPPHRPGIEIPPDCDFPQILRVRRSYEILYSTPPVFSPPLTPGERAIAFMMSGNADVFVSKGAIDRLRRLKKDLNKAKSKGKSSAVPALSSACEAPKKKRQVEADAYAIEDRDICLTIPSTVHAYYEFASHFEESKKLLFLSDRGTFDQIGLTSVGEVGTANLIKGTQALFYSNEKALEFEGEIRRLKAANVGLHSELEAAKATLVEAKALALEHQKMRESEANRFQSTLSELDDIRAQLDVSQKEREVIAIQTQIKVTADLMRQFQVGKAESWNFEAAYAEERELQQMFDLKDVDATPAAGLASDFDGICVADYLSDEQPRVQQFEADQPDC